MKNPHNAQNGGTVDVTQRKKAEEALWAANRKLINAQEQERARIGRELHDDINQRLAMLAVELEELQEKPAEVGSRVQELRRKIGEISNDVQALSHELHSSRLEYLGVIKGLKSWCKEFAQRQRLEIDFTSEVSSVLPHEIGICFFRVLQEVLHNAVKHSGAKRIEVQLREHSNEVHLVIHARPWPRSNEYAGASSAAERNRHHSADAKEWDYNPCLRSFQGRKDSQLAVG